MNTSPQRGAARVSAVWLIVLLVLLGVTAAFVYVQAQDASRAREELARVTAQRNEAQGRIEEELNKTVEMAKLVGYRDASDPLSVTNATAYQEALSGLKQVFPDIESAKNFEELTGPLATAYKTAQQKLVTAQAEIESLRGQVAAKDKANREIASELQGRIKVLETEKADAAQVAADSIADLERRVAEVTNKFTQASDAVTEEKGRYRDLVAKSERDAQAAAARTKNVNEQLDALRFQSTQSDGEVLNISAPLGIGWINRGAKDRVAAGMKFEVKSGNPNPSRALIKAYAEVTEVEETRSQVHFFDLADPADPPVTGDKIYNPLYQPGARRFAVLAGAFTGEFNEAELKMLLDEIGITVQDHLDNTTNYLIAGNPMYVDENGEPVTDPIQPSDLAVYKDAQAMGCAIVPYGDLRKFFRK